MYVLANVIHLTMDPIPSSAVVLASIARSTGFTSAPSGDLGQK